MEKACFAPGEKRNAALLVLAALLLRAAYSWFTGVPPFSDAAEWDKARLALLAGEPYTAHWTPLYALALAGFSLVSGGSYFSLYLLNSAFIALACLFTWLAAREVFGPRAAMLALAASALYADTVWYSAVLMAESLSVMMVALLTWRFVRSGPTAANGFLLGLTCLTKGLFLVLLPVFLLWGWLRGEGPARLRRAALFAGAALLTLAPWAARNFVVYRAPVLLEPHWASAVFVGHNPYTTGGCDYTFAGTEYGKFYSDKSIGIVEMNRIFLRKSLEFMRDNPLRELELTVLRASKHLTFATSFVMYREPYPARKALFALALLQHLVLFPLCALGIALSWRDRRALGFSLIVAVLAGVFVTLFSANTRMRLALTPALITLAAYAALQLPGLAARLRAREPGLRGAALAAGAAALLLFANFAWQAVTRLGDVAGRFN